MKRKTKESQELYWLAMNRLFGLDPTEIAHSERKNWEESPIKPMVIGIYESFSLLESYLDQDENCEIILDGMRVGQEISGPPLYEHVLTAVNATDCWLRHLSLFINKITESRFEKLVNDYEKLRLRCDQFRAEELERKR